MSKESDQAEKLKLAKKIDKEANMAWKVRQVILECSQQFPCDCLNDVFYHMRTAIASKPIVMKMVMTLVTMMTSAGSSRGGACWCIGGL